MYDKSFNIKESDLQNICDDQSWERGYDYYDTGMIINPVLVDDTLQARCTGSSAEEYIQKIQLSDKGIDSYDCSCPRGDFCKHL
ncbi:MAG TPA: hypothetical protein DC057_02585, partial [Spirochaetia bacterium]|nr:hypothetical protein [Spirochaetia bacterium]